MPATVGARMRRPQRPTGGTSASLPGWTRHPPRGRLGAGRGALRSLEVASQAASTRAPTRRRIVGDAVLAVIVLLLTIGILVGNRDESDGDARRLDLLGVALAASASLPLAFRRRAPLGVFAVPAAASVVTNWLGYAPGPPLGATIALYTVAVTHDGTRRSTRLAVGTVVGFFLLHVAGVAVAHGEWPVVPFLVGALVWGGAWVLGDRIRMRRERLHELEERAARAEREAERERRLAAAEERNRIARDLHDSAGHAINVILVQAGAARLLGERDPARARAALETIEEVARETVGEIDQLVGALREGESPEDARSAVEPPGLA